VVSCDRLACTPAAAARSDSSNRRFPPVAGTMAAWCVLTEPSLE
jgi:hypothetical protein